MRTDAPEGHSRGELTGGFEFGAFVFRSNDASSHLALADSLPKVKAALLAGLDPIFAQPEQAPFVPEWMRGL